MTLRVHRDDIDWLRAVAVLSVCFFHWHISPFRGGYVGVDVFFVVSGFLITQIIQSEVRQGTFSFAQFYERRVRRLLPALYFMIVLTVIASFFLLLPVERRELFKSVIATITFTSNIFFWQQSGYFETSADDKLLLHTWSLSVEEQFYLMLPVVIWLLARVQARRFSQVPLLQIVLGALALLSFVAGYRLIARGDINAAFFFSPPRAWEFLLGSLVAIEGLPTLRNIHLQRTGRIIGLILILVAVFGYRPNTTFPGVNALLPCLGAAIYLWSGISAPAVVRWRWSPVHVANFFGRISYSLYLWHWPVVIYARFASPTYSLNSRDIFMVAAISVALSYFSYRFIEQPIRRRAIFPTRGSVLRFVGGATAAMVVASVAAIVIPNGDTDKDDIQIQTYMNYDYKESYEAGKCFGSHSYDACIRMFPDKTNILVWGDSAAMQYVYGLRATLDPNKTNVMPVTAGSCFASLDVESNEPGCAAASRAVAGLIEKSKPDLVIISEMWPTYLKWGYDQMIGSLLKTAAVLKEKGIPLMIVGPPVTYRGRLPVMLLRARARSITLKESDIVDESVFALDQRMKASLSSRDGITYVSILDALCPNGHCPVRLDNGALMSWDAFHLTTDGSLLAAPHLAAAMKQILRLPK